MTATQTVGRTALLVREGDTLVDPDGRRHTVITHFAQDLIAVTLHTDTGLHLRKCWYEAHTEVLRVLPGPGWAGAQPGGGRR
jgi:hypothetical protein